MCRTWRSKSSPARSPLPAASMTSARYRAGMAWASLCTSAEVSGVISAWGTSTAFSPAQGDTDISRSRTAALNTAETFC
jgi:hypothetical protein